MFYSSKNPNLKYLYKTNPACKEQKFQPLVLLLQAVFTALELQG